MDLRKALLADHGFRYDIGAEQRADRAVAIVAAWLRDEADELRRLAADAKDRRDDGDQYAAGHYRRFLAQAVALEERAVSLTLTEENRDDPA